MLVLPESRMRRGEFFEISKNAFLHRYRCIICGYGDGEGAGDRDGDGETSGYICSSVVSSTIQRRAITTGINSRI